MSSLDASTGSTCARSSSSAPRLLIASYALLLALLRQYLGKRLTPIPVLAIGVTWFSLADVENSLGSFQVGWFLTVFFFVAMLFALQVLHSRRAMWLAVAVIAAFAASLSTLQGFLCWPLGATCILWNQSWVRRTARDCHVVRRRNVTVVLYFPGYNFRDNGCLHSAACSSRVALHHPLTAVGFFFALIGNVIPSGKVNFATVYQSLHSVAGIEVVVGVALFATAVFILVQSWHYRASRERFPLPLLLIGFSLLFDVTITLGRSAGGPSSAIYTNRYVMANLILLTGVVMYACAHISPRRLTEANGTWGSRLAGRPSFCWRFS